MGRNALDAATLLKQAQVEQISHPKVDAECVQRALAEARPDVIVSVSCPQKIGSKLIQLGATRSDQHPFWLGQARAPIQHSDQESARW